MSEITNNKEGVPLAHYAALYAGLDAADAVARTGAKYTDGRGFGVEIFDHRVICGYPEFSLAPGGDGCPKALLNNAAAILFMRWLIEGRGQPFGGKFLSYRELPWGAVYEQAFDGRCRKRLAGTFGRDIAGFSRAAEKLGGARVNMGDAAYDLPLPGHNTLRLILREGDEEFPATAQILFSDNITAAWSAEDLAVLGEVAIRALTEEAFK